MLDGALKKDLFEKRKNSFTQAMPVYSKNDELIQTRMSPYHDDESLVNEV